MRNSRRSRAGRLLRAEGEPLVRIGWAIGGMLVLAVLIAAGLTVAGLYLLNIHGTQAEKLSATTLYNLLKIAFAVAAGVGGVIALVTAYRRQRYIEFSQALAQLQHQLAARAEERAARDSQLERELATTRLFNERFATAASQLGDDKPAAVRLAGVYAMAGLADDWPDQRQTCVDVLCAYLRMPYQADPGEGAPAAEGQAFQALREVRHTVIRVLTAHLQSDDRRAATIQDWRGLDLDFTNAVFDGGVFTGAQFTGGQVSFTSARFTAGQVSFAGVTFSGAVVSFDAAQFTGGAVRFVGAVFSDGEVRFGSARFSGKEISFHHSVFSGGEVIFGGVEFSSDHVVFTGAEISGGQVIFTGAEFTGGEVSFDGAKLSDGCISFASAEFSGANVRFGRAIFSGGLVSFAGARFVSGLVDFADAEFSGSRVSFDPAVSSRGQVDFPEFSGGQVDFSQIMFPHVTPPFPRWETPPTGVKLPDGY